MSSAASAGRGKLTKHISDRVLKRAHVAQMQGTSLCYIAKLNRVPVGALKKKLEEYRKDMGLKGAVSYREFDDAATKAAPSELTVKQQVNALFIKDKG